MNTVKIYKGEPFATVDWSYPASTNAKRFKTPAGCWTVNLCFQGKDMNGRSCYGTKAQAGGFATKEAAQAWKDANLPNVSQLISKSA